MYAFWVEVIVTGVAGYIGAHVAAQLLESGHKVIGIDNLSTGVRDFVDPRIRFHEGDVENSQFLDSVFSGVAEPSQAGVIHCAGIKFASESVKNPIAFYTANSYSTLSLLKSMKRANITKMVFSSSCSVYGQIQSSTPVTESELLQPISPYGRSKMIAELMINDSVREGWLKAISLRYFNVVGNDKIKAFDTSDFNLFPNVYRAAESCSDILIFGDKYGTHDGTCVRDYVHVIDLAAVHLRAMNKIMDGAQLEFAYNLGSGIGYSVLEIVNSFTRHLGMDLKYKIEMAREGDPAEIRADISRAVRDLDWSGLRSLNEMLEDGWRAWQQRIKVP